MKKTPDVDVIEAALVAVTTRELARFDSRLAQNSLRYTAPERQVVVAEPEAYTSEIRIYFWRQNDIVDALEFFRIPQRAARS